MPQLCLNPNELTAFLLGKVASEQKLEAVAGHLEGCNRCQSAAESMEQGRDSILAGLQAPSQSDTFFSDTGIQPFLNRAKSLVRPTAQDEETVADATIDFLPNRGRIRDCKILHRIGQGGMGTVYKANHTVLGRTVAVKVLPPDRMDDSQAGGRFQKEMQAVGKVNHPHIIQAHDAGFENGVHFLMMEYVEGADLKQVMRNQLPLSVADACEVIRQAALGLQGVMENGLVHRDIKPSNLMLTPDQHVKILDLGLARLAPSPAKARPVPDMTFSGQLLGTVDYMAPEQIEASDKADIRADIYSLGCTFYHLLTGRVPFEGDMGEKLDSHRMKEPAPIDSLRPDIPKRIVEVVRKMMCKNPGERFVEPQEVADAVQGYCGAARLESLLRNAKAQPAVPFRSPSVWRRWPVWLGVGVTAACILLMAFFILRVRTPNGTLLLEFPEGVPKDVQVYVDGDRVLVERIDDKKARITFAVGKRKVVVKKGNKTLSKETIQIGHKGLPPMMVRLEKRPPLAKKNPDLVPNKPKQETKPNKALPKRIYSNKELEKKRHPTKLILEITTKLGVQSNGIVQNLGYPTSGFSLENYRWRDLVSRSKIHGFFVAVPGSIIVVPPDLLHSVTAEKKHQVIKLRNGVVFTGTVLNHVGAEDGRSYYLGSAKKVVAIPPKSWEKNSDTKSGKWTLQLPGVKDRRFELTEFTFWWRSTQGPLPHGETFQVYLKAESQPIQGHLSKFDRVQVKHIQRDEWNITLKPPKAPEISGRLDVRRVLPSRTDWFLFANTVEGYVLLTYEFTLEKVATADRTKR